MLSGGQRQAVAIARSLLGEPKLVMLDEPTAALGIVQTAQILKLIERLRDRGLGVIVISHNLADVFQVADRIAVLRLGRVAANVRGRRGDPRAGGGRDHRRRRRDSGDRGDATMSAVRRARRSAPRRARRPVDGPSTASRSLRLRGARPRRPRLGPGAARHRRHLDDLPDRQRPLPQRGQPLEPDAADRRRRDDLDRRRARPAARRDRPLGRRRQRARRRRSWRCSPSSTAGRPILGILAGARRRRRDRALQRLHGHPVRRPVVRGHPRRIARPGRGPCCGCSATPARSTCRRASSPTSPAPSSTRSSAGSSAIAGIAAFVGERSCWRDEGGRRPGSSSGRWSASSSGSSRSPPRSSRRSRSSTTTAACRSRP